MQIVFSITNLVKLVFARENLFIKNKATILSLGGILSLLIYIPQEFLLMISPVGVGGYKFLIWIIFALLIIFGIFCSAYRTVIKFFPDWGSQYQVLSKNLRSKLVALGSVALLLSDLFLAAMSILVITSLLSTVIFIDQTAALLISILISCGLFWIIFRNYKFVNWLAAIFNTAFVLLILLMMFFAYFKIHFLHEILLAPSTKFALIPTKENFGILFKVFLILRVIAVGTAIFTANGEVIDKVPAFNKFTFKNAYPILIRNMIVFLAGLLVIFHFIDILKIKYVADTNNQLVGMGDNYHQLPVIMQIILAIFAKNSLMYCLLLLAMLGLLFFSAIKYLKSFSVAVAFLASKNYLPKRFMLSNKKGIFYRGIFLGLIGMWLVLLVGSGPFTTVLLMYSVVALLAISIVQWGMVKYWRKILFSEFGKVRRRKIKYNLLFSSATILLSLISIILIFTNYHDLWIGVLISFFVIFMAYLCYKIRISNINLASKLQYNADNSLSPNKIRGIVLVQNLDSATDKAIEYALSTKPDYIEALTVNLDEEETDKLKSLWDVNNKKIPLKVLASSRYDYCQPILNYLDSTNKEDTAQVTVVYFPEIISGNRIERITYNDLIESLKRKLRKRRGIIVASIPWQVGQK